MAKRWTIPFKSFANKQCRIDIYDPSFSGTVTELSTSAANAPGVPATDPFYFEEDDDDDLLKVVRLKTGYINLIETVQDGLIDIYPTTLKSRYVEVFYDNAICFRGYIQQQSFENAWQAVPREVSLPVISVMGIAESLEFDAEMTIIDNKIGYYMKKLLAKLEPTDSTAGITKYSRVTFPDNVAPNPSTFAGDFAATLRPLVTTTDNPDFSKVLNGSGAPFKGISLYKFLEGVCNAYGWIVHDLPDRLLFTKFDNDPAKKYYYYPVIYGSTADIQTATGKTEEHTESTLALATTMEPSSDDATITQIMPMRTVTLKPDGEFIKSVGLEFDHMRCTRLKEGRSNDEKFILAILDNADANYKDVESTYLLPYTDVNSSGEFTSNGVVACDLKNKKRVIVQRPYLWQGSGNMFRLNFWKRPQMDPNQGVTGNLKMEVETSFGQDIFSLGHIPFAYGHFIIRFDLYCGVSLLGTKTLDFYDEDDYKQTVEFEGVNVPLSNALCLFVQTTNANDWTLTMLSFDTIRLFYDDDLGSEYMIDNKNYQLISDPSQGGIEDAEVDMLMSCYYINTNMIGSNRLQSYSYFTSYQYLRQPQNRLQLRMRPRSGQAWPGINAYMDKIQFWKNDWRWRLIALTFHPWDDEWTLTLHRSPVLEGG